MQFKKVYTYEANKPLKELLPGLEKHCYTELYLDNKLIYFDGDTFYDNTNKYNEVIIHRYSVETVHIHHSIIYLKSEIA